MDETGCDYIMIGRAAMGNPFLFKQINQYLKTGQYRKYTIKDRLELFFDYLSYSSEYKIKFSKIKGHAIRFTKGITGGTKLRINLTNAKNPKELEKIMHEALPKIIANLDEK